MKYPLIILAAIATFCLIFTGQSGTACAQPALDSPGDTARVIDPLFLLEPPIFPGEWHDDEFEPSEQDKKICAECKAKQGNYEWEKLKHFKELIYNPAMDNPKLPAENKRFLKALYEFMLGDTLSHQVYHEPDAIIRPVYKFNDRHVRIGSHFDKFYDDGQPVIRLTYRDSSTQYYLYRSNSSRVRPVKIRDVELYRTECSWFRSYELYIAPKSDTLQPAICSPFKIVLDYKSDTTMNRLLDEDNWCEDHCRWFHGSCNEQITFAELKQVPNLWLTTDKEGWQEAGFQTRTLVMVIDGKYLVELWRYELDMSSIGCI
jgi:uncharacterized protein YodC (DUF2158 family)